MRKTWTAPTLKDFNVSARKRVKPDSDIGESVSLPEPKSVKELTVHPKKIEEVRKWVASCFSDRSALLLICGPPGSGKTVTLKLVADAEGFTLIEWISPVSKTLPCSILEEHGSEKHVFFDMSEGKKFEDFIIRSGRYPSLFEPRKPTLILVKDIPNAFIWKPEQFHSFVHKYKNNGRFPIAFIVTDDENLDLHGLLFPNDLKLKYNITVIKFNPVSDTLLKKNLKNLSVKLHTGILPQEYLEKITKNAVGDLRSATTDVLMQLRIGDLSKNQITKKRKMRSKVGDEGQTEESSLNPLGSRDHCYDFYKKMGRILYPKRTSEEGGGDLVHNVLEIADNWCKSYQAFLHENYLQTCSKLQDAMEASNYFSFCDILARHKEVENCSSIVTVAGLMTSNTQPKKTGFLPFKKSVNLRVANNWRCVFNEASVLRYGVQERVFALDIAPLKRWLPVNDSSTRTLISGEREGDFIKSYSQATPVESKKHPITTIDMDVCNDDDNEENSSDIEENLEIEEVED